MKKKYLKFIFVFSLIVFLEPQILKENSFIYVKYFDNAYRILKLFCSIFICILYLKNKKISLFTIMASILEFVLCLSTIIFKGDIIRFAGPGLTVISMAMLAELMYDSEYFIESLKKVNIYLRITFLVNLLSVFLVDYTSFSKITKVYFWGIDNRFVFTMIPWIIFEAIVSIKEKSRITEKWLFIVLLCEGLLLFKKSVAAFLLIALFILVYFLQKVDIKKIKTGLLTFLAYIAVNCMFVFTKISYLFKPVFKLLGKDPTLSGRVFLWDGVLKLLKDHLLIGNGMQSIPYDKEFFFISSAPYYYPWCKVIHAHNSIMTLLYRGGIFAAFIYLFILAIVFFAIDNLKDIKYKVLFSISFFIILFLSIFDTIDFACLYFIFGLVICLSSKNLEDYIYETKIFKLFVKLCMTIYRYVMVFIFNFFPINNNKIYVSNYYGKGYGDSPKAVIEELNRLYPDTQVCWVIDDIKKVDKNSFPSNVLLIQKDSPSFFYHVCTSKVWIDNRRPIIELTKRKEQYYVQLWHGGIALKKIEKDAEDALNKRYVRAAKKDSKHIDLMISNSDSCTKIFKNSFWYSGEIKEYGTPRNDILFQKRKHKRIINKIKKYYNLNDDDKILLYAPTFRKDSNLKAYDIDFNKLEKTLIKKYGGNWKIFIKLHPNISNKNISHLVNKKNIMNVSNYSDMQELMIASDILITDYSSVMFEFSFLKKPVFIYANDIDDYNNDRGFYVDLYTLPYIVSENNRKLNTAIINFDYKKYVGDLKKFFKEVGLKESGKAAQMVALDIIGVLKNGKK